MRYLRQLMIVLIPYVLGTVLQLTLKLPIPGSVIGLILLFLGLQIGIVKIEMIEELCEFLLSNMSFLFIPAGVGLMTAFGVLKGKWIPFMIIVVFSTCVVWIVTALVVKILRKGRLHE
ncbi:CidA/LrgA family protein [Clostridium estertheticum]|uniref:CidA/LrgA family protein n=1 Tax=Clostridium estertheticum TaxID=238834 RepID=A0A7Y3WRX0_9CLOT|nr:CidA/LrgA family protein [Clostridium estertheticum]MBU3155936.1 CidA/LrgA family protein [Clostridium estertheticum]MBU3200549.1 CidA/LrgA family protein [Clostridium estertheticum]MBU3215338.1 CidA/LrgA family protein [Clostridium estertheticum]MBW9173802.1 CidA/LrgA family protein [Clostridium estertheticum]MBX4270965.1 CidA/LrgA family protein [Clostridium estertheticum]